MPQRAETGGDGDPKRQAKLEYMRAWGKANRERKRVYNEVNRDKNRGYDGARRVRDKEKRRQQYKAFYDANAERLRAEKRIKRTQNSTRYAAYVARRVLLDPEFRLMLTLRARVRVAIRKVNGSKAAKTQDLIGCSVQELRDHLQSQFRLGMSWTNHGRSGWHVDHIVPCSAFDLLDPEHQRRCFHFTNLQPLWAGENLRKGDR